MYPEPYSGRTLVRRLVELGLERVRLLADVYQVRSLDPFTHSLLKRRTEIAMQFGLIRPRQAGRWPDTLPRGDAGGPLRFTFQYLRGGRVQPGRGPPHLSDPRP